MTVTARFPLLQCKVFLVNFNRTIQAKPSSPELWHMWWLIWWICERFGRVRDHALVLESHRDPLALKVERLHSLVKGFPWPVWWPHYSGLTLNLNPGFLPKIRSIWEFIDLQAFSEHKSLECLMLCQVHWGMTRPSPIQYVLVLWSIIWISIP